MNITKNLTDKVLIFGMIGVVGFIAYKTLSKKGEEKSNTNGGCGCGCGGKCGGSSSANGNNYNKKMVENYVKPLWTV